MSEEIKDKSSDVKINANADKGKNSYTEEYVSELRNENHTLRLKASEIESLKNKEIEQKDNDYKKTIDEKIKEISSSYKKELILSKLETEALSLGIIDPEVARLIDTSKITFDENNKILGLKDAVDEFKKSKPHLFRKSESSSYSGKLPEKKDENETIDVSKMNAQQYAVHKAKIISNR